jgi:3',5'-cyclic-nucleotide phosphodiesterase
MRKLFITEGPDKGKTFDLKGDRLFLGRTQANDIQINDKYVSSRHLEIIWDAGRYKIKDLQSSNGTFVNGNRLAPGIEVEVEEGIPIKTGFSVICLGKPVSDEVMIPDSSPSVIAASSQEPLADISDRSNALKNNFDLLSKVAHIVTQPLELDDVLDKILDYFFGLLKRIDRGHIILIDIETRDISKVLSRSRSNTAKGTMGYDLNVVSQVINDKKAVMISDIQEASDSNKGFSGTLKLMKIGSVMCIPLINRSKVYGVIYLDTIDKTHGFRDDDLSLLTALSGPAALAIENIYLRSKLRDKEDFTVFR